MADLSSDATSDATSDAPTAADTHSFEVEFEPRMSDPDALLWAIEKDPLLRTTVVTIYLLDRAPDRERFVPMMDRLSRTIPRLRQHVVSHAYSISPPRWDVDPNFDLHYHLRWMRAPYGGTSRELFDIAEPICMQGFDRARPLWEATVVEGLADGRAALIAKFHHSITDGVGGVKLQMEMLDLEREPAIRREELDMPDAPEAHPIGEARRAVDALGYEVGRQLTGVRAGIGRAFGTFDQVRHDPLGVGTGAVRTLGSVARILRPATEPCSPLTTGRSLSVRFDSIELPVAALKQAGRVVGGRLNDAFVAGVAGGFGRYHRVHGIEGDLDLRMTMPVNVRDEASAQLGGNRFVPTRFLVPIGIEDPIARLDEIRRRAARVRAEPALGVTDAVAGILNRLPATATTALFGSMLHGVDFVTSNVPGPPVPVYIAGAAVESQLAFGPMTGSAANLVLLSYGDDASVGINLDPAAIPDGDTFVECVRDSFDELLKLG